MSLAFHLPMLPASPTAWPGPRSVAVAIRYATPVGLAGTKKVTQAMLVLSILAVMLVAAVGMGLLVWVPHFHLH